MHGHGMSPAEERLAHDPTSELWGEHRSRYLFAAQHGLVGKLVLDVACGVGFGTEILLDAGADVIGMDLDLEALAEARRANPDAPLARVDAACLPLPEASVDAVVSMETIEHVPDAARLVAELARVLRPGGQLVLSTPNRAFGPPERHTGNPFHIREFTGEELGELLREHFADVTIFGQWVVPAYKYVPYLLADPRFDPWSVPWKLMNRLPFRVKELFARTISGRGFYPGDTDYQFLENHWEGAHALLAVASGPRKAPVPDAHGRNDRAAAPARRGRRSRSKGKG